MITYYTIEEMAEKWGVSTRHIQYLCREGKIEGAVKRVGAWFIPEDAPVPAKTIKASEDPYNFTGTKKRIFECAIEQFARMGYENVSISDIADSAGIRQSAVYNHFKSKKEILHTIYGFCVYYYHYSRPGSEVLEPLLVSSSVSDIIEKGFIYEFGGDIFFLMSSILKIILERASTDEKAAEVFKEVSLEDGVNFVEDGLNRAVEVGRLAPFDMHTIAVLINSVRLYMLFWWLVAPPLGPEVFKDEHNAYALIAKLLTDLKPSGGKQK